MSPLAIIAMKIGKTLMLLTRNYADTSHVQNHGGHLQFELDPHLCYELESVQMITDVVKY